MFTTPSEAGKKIESYINHVKRLQQDDYADNQSGRKQKTQDLNYVYKNYHRKSFYASILKYCTTAEKYAHLIDFLVKNRGFIGKIFKQQLGFSYSN